ncbi:MAG: hypothetical protein Q9166_006022 [cf. Caloplaca sp. 2 TL-2023]
MTDSQQSLDKSPAYQNDDGGLPSQKPHITNGILSRLRKQIRASTSRMKTAWEALFRALGLHLVTHALVYARHPMGRGFHETTKIAIHRDRSIALLRALIHVAPVGAALCEIVLNWNTYYVGATAYNTASYQLLAKVHEIMMQASIAAIVFSGIRSQLALGEGIPFGLLFSGLQITQISYLWSMELWGSLRSGLLGSSKRSLALLLIPMCILLAAVCGPSSAVLLIPRSQFWPGGSTSIWINATHDQLWPLKTDTQNIPVECKTITLDQLSIACPSSGWQSIRNYLWLEKQTLPEPYKELFQVASAHPRINVAGRTSLRQLAVGESQAYLGLGPRPYAVTTQHGVVSDALTSTGALWYLALTNVTAGKGHGSPLSDQSNAVHMIHKDYSQPYSTAVCLPDTATSPDDKAPVEFPRLPNANKDAVAANATYHGCRPGSEKPAQVIAHPSVTRAQVFNLAEQSSQYKLHWIELEHERFSGSSIGAIIVLPRTDSITDRKFLVCNLSAGWGTSSIAESTYNGGNSAVRSSMTNTTDHAANNPSIQQTNVPAGDFDQSLASYFEYSLPYYPQQVIDITRDWAQYLNPAIADLNTTVIDVLLQQWIFSCSPRHSAGVALASLLVNGLANSGTGSQLQGSVRTVGPNGSAGLDGNYWLSGKGDMFNVEGLPTQDWVKLRVDSKLEGYAYNTVGGARKAAIAFLATYCLFALAHIVYAAWSGLSSSCWDSIAEVTALAINSSPTSALRNTCAGIKELYVFKLPVRVLVRNDMEGEGEHLELVFGKTDQEKPQECPIKVNRAYGTMPARGDLN